MADATTAATQDFVPIKEIRDGVVILEDGQYCAVLLASSINFALKSSDEQHAILAQFQAFLNTLDFSLQIYVQSRRLDISPYLAILSEREPDQYNDLMKIQLREYMEFIKAFTTEVDIMSKNFFVVVPYTPTEIDVKGIKSMFKKETNASIDPKKFAEHRTQLEQRIAVVQQGLVRIGVRTALLGTQELTELYYHIFNPIDVAADAPKL